VSNRKFTILCFSSGPWHAKQLSEKIGRISRLKSTPLAFESGWAAKALHQIISAAVIDPARRNLKNRFSNAYPPLAFFPTSVSAPNGNSFKNDSLLLRHVVRQFLRTDFVPIVLV
jgi:hypothetical protein